MSDISYIKLVECTFQFLDWLSSLDRSVQIRIDQRIQRLIDSGNPGLHRRFDHLLEIKWKSGSMGSFRIYCAEINQVTLLLGGHKDSQVNDIKKAKEILQRIQNGTIRTKKYE